MQPNPLVHRPRRRLLVWAAALAGVYACSFQDFSSLQDGGGSSGGGTSGGGDGSGGAGGAASTGGSPDTGGAASGGVGPGSGGGGLGGMGGVPVSFIENGSFETGNTSSWDVVPSSALQNRHVYVQTPTGTVPAPDGVYELAFWHDTDSYQVTISQVVEDLEDGTYTLAGFFSRGANMTATLFARNCSDKDPEPRDIPMTDPNSFTLFRLTDIEVSGGRCEVGVMVDAGPGDWMNMDMLTLTKE